MDETPIIFFLLLVCVLGIIAFALGQEPPVKISFDAQKFNLKESREIINNYNSGLLFEDKVLEYNEKISLLVRKPENIESFINYLKKEKRLELIKKKEVDKRDFGLVLEFK